MERKVFPSSLEDRFLNLDRCTCNDIMFDDMNDPRTREMFERNNGKYCVNNGFTAVIVGNQIYVSPFRGISKLLESYGFEEGSFTVPFSVDFYEDYPHALGTESIIRIAANNLEDPVGELGYAQEQIFGTRKFTKWNRLVREATRQDGLMVDLAEYHRKIYNAMYEGPENREARERRNSQLRALVKEHFIGDRRIAEEVDRIEREHASAKGTGRRR